MMYFSINFELEYFLELSHIVWLSKFQPLTLIVPDEWSSKLSQLGHTMAVFPVAPRFAKMLSLSHQSSLLNYTVAIVAALSVQEFLLAGDKRWLKVWRQWAGVGNSLLLGNSSTSHCYKSLYSLVYPSFQVDPTTEQTRSIFFHQFAYNNIHK